MALPSVLSTDKSPVSLNLYVFAICLLGVWSLLIIFLLLGFKTGLSICPCHCMIPSINLSIQLLDTSQLGDFLSLPGHLLKNIIKLGTLSLMTPLSLFKHLVNFHILEFPTAKYLGCSVVPWKIYLGAHISLEGFWAFSLGFCLSLFAAGGHNVCFNSTAPWWSQMRRTWSILHLPCINCHAKLPQHYPSY